jgi:alpha-ketoglutarate-dependent 2,4-dichlorophenoxyacetate dioxygenase
VTRSVMFDEDQLRPLAEDFAVELSGVDLTTTLEPELVESILRLIADAGVLVIRDQPVTDTEQIRFSSRLGPLETYPSRDYLTSSAHPEIAVVSNVDPTTDEVMPPLDRRRAYNDANALWHSDSSFRAIPAAMSILSGREVPPSGGDTHFADMRIAWNSLSEDERSALAGRVGRHSLAYSRRRLSGFDFSQREAEQVVNTVRQPLVRTHPVNARCALFLGAHLGQIEGMSDEESQEAADRWQRPATAEDRIYVHRWRRGDIVIWDNRSVLHRATPYLANQHRRVMHRTVVAETGPLIEQS